MALLSCCLDSWAIDVVVTAIVLRRTDLDESVAEHLFAGHYNSQFTSAVALSYTTVNILLKVWLHYLV